MTSSSTLCLTTRKSSCAVRFFFNEIIIRAIRFCLQCRIFYPFFLLHCSLRAKQSVLQSSLSHLIHPVCASNQHLNRPRRPVHAQRSDATPRPDHVPWHDNHADHARGRHRGLDGEPVQPGRRRRASARRVRKYHHFCIIILFQNHNQSACERFCDMMLYHLACYLPTLSAPSCVQPQFSEF